jgi:hypothetical protein
LFTRAVKNESQALHKARILGALEMEYSKFVELKGKLVEKLFLIVVELSGCHE